MMGTISFLNAKHVFVNLGERQLPDLQSILHTEHGILRRRPQWCGFYRALHGAFPLRDGTWRLKPHIVHLSFYQM